MATPQKSSKKGSQKPKDTHQPKSKAKVVPSITPKQRETKATRREPETNEGVNAIQEPPKLWRWVILIVGLIAMQFALYAPSLLGQKVLLPLDILQMPGQYLPAEKGVTPQPPENRIFSDLVESAEPQRQFAAEEFKNGRLPLWNPYQYAGSFFLFPFLSPFGILLMASSSPIVLPWVNLILALVAGTGLYVFLRRTLQLSFWPSTLAAWAYPLGAFTIFFYGYWLNFATCWMPWLLLSVWAVLKGQRFSLVYLAIFTWLTLAGLRVDVAGMILFASGIYACVTYWGMGMRPWLSAAHRRPLLVMTLGWALGFMLISPQVFPMLEYLKTGLRMESRAGGEEERPPVGSAALPQVLLPKMNGSFERGSAPCFLPGEPNVLESNSTAYAGGVLLLLFVPLSLALKEHRKTVLTFGILGLLGIAWCVDFPGWAAFARLTHLSSLSLNRFTFAFAFSVVVLSAIGMQALLSGAVRRQGWLLIPLCLTAAWGFWCFSRLQVLPPEVLNLEQLLASYPGVAPGASFAEVKHWFEAVYMRGTLWAGVAFIGWLCVFFLRKGQALLPFLFGAAAVLELVQFGFGENPQRPWSEYYPPIPAVQKVVEATGKDYRALAYSSAPASVLSSHGLRDVRGYDGSDPKRIVELILLSTDPQRAVSGPKTQWLAPTIKLAGVGQMTTHPVLDLLGVRYFIFRGEPPSHVTPVFTSPDYWVLENKNALPRAFVPERVETVTSDSERLSKLGWEGFNPAAVAYVEEALNLPEKASGKVTLKEQTPTRLEINAEMETPGLLVVTDQWDVGWKATVNGSPAPIIKANHALRGVVLPKGSAKVEMFYFPDKLKLGLIIAGAAVLIILAWGARELIPVSGNPTVK